MAISDPYSGEKEAPTGIRKETYKGHEIIYPADERGKKVFIDGRPVRWGEADGIYYLEVYAYDRGYTLEKTVKRYIDYLEKTG